MNWNHHFADRASAMRRNTVREFLKFAALPGMISFAGGLPAPELFPLADVRAAVEKVLACHGGKSLQYGETEGVRELRAWIAGRARVGVENVLITTGAQQALDLIGRLLLNPGDHVAVENPTYLSLLTAWSPLSIQFTPAPSDENGLDPGAIPPEAKLLYLTPNFQNPTGATLAGERRETLADLAMEKGLIVIEDDPYVELRFEGEALPSLFSLAGGSEGLVIHVGTFSKVLAPGIRIGWIIADAALIEKLAVAKQPLDLHTSTWNQYLALEMVLTGFLPAHISKLRAAYRVRRDAMLAALKRFMPSPVRWTKPAGGMFLFVTLPDKIDAALVARSALDEKVLIVPGVDFHLQGGKNTIRLNFSNAQPEIIETGIERLARIIRAL